MCDNNFPVELPVLSKRKLAIIKVIAQHSILDPQLLTKSDTFDFLNPKNSLHGLFLEYVRQYELVKSGTRPFDGNVLLKSIELAKRKEIRQTNNEETETNAHEDMRDEGWHDFLVLETVRFFSSDINGSSVLSAPLTLEEMELERTLSSKEPEFKSPITGEFVPASKFNEHIRVHSLDPRYYNQKRKEVERQQSTNLDTDRAADNVFRLAEKRRKLNEELGL